MHCSKCGAENDGDAQYCSKCGHNLKDNNTGQVNNSKNTSMTWGKLIAICIVLFIVVAIAGVYVSAYEKRMTATEQLKKFSEIENTTQQKIDQIAQMIDSEDITSIDVNKLKSDFEDIDTGIIEAKAILDKIDKTSLTDEEKEELEVSLFDIEYGSDLLNALERMIPSLINNLKNMEANIEAGNIDEVKSSIDSSNQKIDLFLSDLSAIEKKISNKQMNSDSKAMDDYCSEALTEIKGLRETFSNIELEFIKLGIQLDIQKEVSAWQIEYFKNIKI